MLHVNLRNVTDELVQMHLSFGIVVRPTHPSDPSVRAVPPSGNNEFRRRRIVLNDRTAPESKNLSRERQGILKDAEDEDWDSGDKNFPAAHALKFKESTLRCAR